MTKIVCFKCHGKVVVEPQVGKAFDLVCLMCGARKADMPLKAA